MNVSIIYEWDFTQSLEAIFANILHQGKPSFGIEKLLSGLTKYTQ